MNTEPTDPPKDDSVLKETWKREGTCLRCGKCCTSIVTTLKYIPELDDYLIWMGHHIGVTVRHDEDNGLVHIEFANKCRCLRFKKKKAECVYYFSNRPKICQEFPAGPDSGIDCKGYTFELVKSEEVDESEVETAPIEKGSEEDFENKKPKWDIEGACTRCGKCCSTIVTTLMYKPEIRDYLEWLSLHKGVIVKRDKMTNFVWIEFKNKCRHLRFKRDKAVCKIYNDRPKVCREFPLNPIVGKNCTGYTFKLADPAQAP
jgi:Fe-S-cluster containining protein